MGWLKDDGALMRLAASETQWHKRLAAKGQDRRIGSLAAREGCLFCGSKPCAWAQPMRREVEDGEGSYLFPAWLPLCDHCTQDLAADRIADLQGKLEARFTKRGDRRMRSLMPQFLAGRDGAPQPRDLGGA